DPIVPATLPQPFLDGARHALRRDPRRRWSVSEIAARLNPVAVAAAAAQSVSPLTVPLSTVPAVPAAKLQVPRLDAAPQIAQPAPPRPQATKPPKKGLELPNYVVPVAAALLVIVAVLALPKILGHRSDSSSSAATAAVQTAARPDPVEKPARQETVPAPKPAAPTATQNSLKAAAEKKATPAPRSS